MLNAVYRESFVDAPRRLNLPHGLTIAETVERMRVDAGFAETGTVCIDGVEIFPGYWHVVRPKPGTIISMHMPAAGGGDDGGKSVFALIASIGLTIATGFIVGGGFATAGGLFTAGSISATALAAGVSLIGSLLLSALVAPPVERKDNSRDKSREASASGNVLEPNGSVVRVVGQRKVFPPLASEPFTYYEGDDEVVEATYILAGPHSISEVRVGSAEIESMTGVEFEIREGFPGDSPLTLTTKQARTESIQSELRGHVIDPDNPTRLESSTGDLADALPLPIVTAARVDPDEVLLHFAWPQGLILTSAGTTKLRVPIRIKMREVGSATWINLPEFHYQAASASQKRATMRLIWTDAPSATPNAPSAEGWIESRILSPGQTVAPISADFIADSYFDSGSGDDYMATGNLGTTAIQNVTMGRYEAQIHLDTATFPKGRYEFEVTRGMVFPHALYSAAAYTVSGSVWDFFNYRTPGAESIVYSRSNISDATYLLRVVSVWNEHPLPTTDFAAIAIKARNRKVDSVSCLAGGYVYDWDGTAWNTLTVTDNPAPHLRDIYAGPLNVDPVPLESIDDDAIVAWRTDCVTNGYRCNALIDGSTVMDAAKIVASCGYAQPRMSEKWGVVRDYNRSAESPIQMFTPNNMSGYKWSKAFARTPDALRVSYDDEDQDYSGRQIVVFKPNASQDTSRIEQVAYKGLTSEAEVTARALYDQAQPVYRQTFHSFETSAESIVCERGDLIAVQHATLNDIYGFGRVVDFVLGSQSRVYSVTLDVGMSDVAGDGWDDITSMGAVPDMGLIGISDGLGMAIRGADGVTRTYTVSVDPLDDHTFILSTPTDDPIGVENLVSIGLVGTEYLRLIVYDVVPDADFKATVVAVDEAAELWT